MLLSWLRLISNLVVMLLSATEKVTCGLCMCYSGWNSVTFKLKIVDCNPPTENIENELLSLRVTCTVQAYTRAL